MFFNNNVIKARIIIVSLAILSLFGLFYYLYPAPQTQTQVIIQSQPCATSPLGIPRILGFPSFPQVVKDKFHELSKNKTNSKDPELIAFLRSVIQPPSGHRLVKASRTLIKTPQAEEVDNVLNKRNGFFVEAGALDGERSSNTIFLEVNKDWTGLLVEPDPYFYTQLIGKNRNSWAINACLSPFNYVTEMKFLQSSGGHGKLQNEDKSGAMIITVPCFPLESLLLAINKTSVDFFSLDVEGAEVPVLKTVPFKEIDIKTLAVEYKHGDYQQYLDVMAQNGYEMTKKLLVDKPELNLYVEDFIFVKTKAE